MSAVETLSIGDMIARATELAAGAWEKEFVESLNERFQQYGERIFISAKQRSVLDRILQRAYEWKPGEPDFDGTPTDPYVKPQPTLEALDVWLALCAALDINGCPNAPEQITELMKIAVAHGWRFAPDVADDAMKAAGSNPEYVGPRITPTHADMIYREMMQKVPGLAPEGAS